MPDVYRNDGGDAGSRREGWMRLKTDYAVGAFAMNRSRGRLDEVEAKTPPPPLVFSSVDCIVHRVSLRVRVGVWGWLSCVAVI